MSSAAGLASRTVKAAARASVILFVLALFVGAQLAVNKIEDASWNAGAARAQYALSLLLATVALAAIGEAIARRRHPARVRLGLAGALLVCCACAPSVYSQQQLAAVRFAAPHLNDIPVTTMAAARTLAAGGNPYTSPVDPRAESRDQHRNYDGFKYMPLMAVAYLPSALAGSDSGVIVTNAVLNVLATALVYLLARSLGGELAGALAVMFYLSLRIVARQLYGPGVTDLAAVVPMLAAFCAVDSLPFLGGLLVGVSVSTKVLPALALVPVFAPAVNPWSNGAGRRFWIGFAVGCLPALLFFVLSPTALLSNVVFFNLYRPVDSTSWLDGHPAWWRTTATVALLLVLVAGAIVRWTAKPARRMRALMILVLIVGMTLLGPVNHGNYQLWWLPWFAAVLGANLATCVASAAVTSTAIGGESEPARRI